jgi:hypothetical protein
MVEWWWKADLLESCNCAEFGCGCNYTSLPTHGNCKAILTWSIMEGAFGEEPLDGLGLAMLLSWPGAIHEANGHTVAYVDERANDKQRAGLAAIARGADKVSFRYEDTWGVYSEVGYNAPWPAPAITSYDD